MSSEKCDMRCISFATGNHAWEIINHIFKTKLKILKLLDTLLKNVKEFLTYISL